MREALIQFQSPSSHMPLEVNRNVPLCIFYLIEVMDTSTLEAEIASNDSPPAVQTLDFDNDTLRGEDLQIFTL